MSVIYICSQCRSQIYSVDGICSYCKNKETLQLQIDELSARVAKLEKLQKNIDKVCKYEVNNDLKRARALYSGF